MTAARAAFEKELAQNPNDFESNLRLAVLLKQDGDYDRAQRTAWRGRSASVPATRARSTRWAQPTWRRVTWNALAPLWRGSSSNRRNSWKRMFRSPKSTTA